MSGEMIDVVIGVALIAVLVGFMLGMTIAYADAAKGTAVKVEQAKKDGKAIGWYEGYATGLEDERISRDVFNGRIRAARNNPYDTKAEGAEQ